MRYDVLALSLSNHQLLSTVQELVTKEREVHYELLSYLIEVDKRNLWAIEGYGSLYSFLIGYLGFSESTALKRSQVIRRAAGLPELLYAIRDGKLTLSAAARLCPYLTRNTVETLLTECAGKTVREVERILVKHFPKAPVEDSVKKKITPLSIDQVHIHFTANQEFAEKLEQALALLSHKYPEGKLADIFTEALDLLLKRKQTHRVSPVKEVSEESAQVSPIDSRYIPRGIQNEVRARDENRCTFVSRSGRRCEQTRFLHYDHIHPWSLGGSSQEASNLRLLCAVHNQLRARETFSISGGGSRMAGPSLRA